MPISLQIVLGALIFTTMRGLRQAQTQLSSVRVAFERERELDELKNRFIANINHELRTPLMSLQGYLILARDFGQQGEYGEQARMFTLGLDAMGHINRLVTSILDVRRIETELTPVQLVPLNVHEAIVKATALLDPREVGASEREIRLRVPANLWAMGDMGRVQQVLVNLLANACKYSPPKTSIEIVARTQATNDAAKKGTGAPQMVEIAIRDYGFGIPPDQLPLLFGRFVRLERDIASPIAGSGLGLALCRAYVTSLGGTIWVTSTGVPGEGSTFTFTLLLAS